ncbi:MAG TPA: hypothetical protein VGK73_25050 [Polyangiaceae bacterium]
MRLKLLAAFAASTIALTSFLAIPAGAEGRFDDDEKPAKGEKKGAKPADSKSEKAKPGAKRFALSPEGLKWNLGIEGVAKLYDKVFDDEYLPLYKKAAPGPETEALDAELKQRKAEVRRSKLEFGDTPTGVDQTALKGEYSYANGESMGRLTLRSGTERYFFFFNDKLWKVYDEHKLKKGTPLGETYEGAVKVLAGKFGGQPKKAPANADKGQMFDESVWTTPDMVIRAIDRGNIIAVVYADRDVQENLASRRRNKPKDEMGMDKDVMAALKSKEPPPDPKKKPDAKDAKKKTK